MRGGQDIPRQQGYTAPMPTERLSGHATPTRRQMLITTAAGAAGAVIGPMINRGRFKLFAQSATQYSTRAIDLMRRAVVMDMLSPFKISSSPWLSRPDTFTAADLQRFKDSGINVFHIAVGLGGQDPYLTTLQFVAQW